MMVGKTERTLKRNVLDLLTPQEWKPRYGEGEGRLLGRQVYLMGANDNTSEAKVRGLTLAGIYGDELVTWPKPFFGQAIQRLSIKDAKLFGTSNPDSPAHYLKKEWLDRGTNVFGTGGGGSRQIDLKRFHFTLADNPYLDPAYKLALELDFTGLWKRRFVDGLWVLAAGAIYDMWDPEKMVVKDVPICSQYWLCVDYGTATVFAALLIGLGVDNRLYVVREWRWDARLKGRQLTDSEYSQQVRDWIDDLQKSNVLDAEPSYWYVDPSATSFITQLWRDQVGGIRPADNDVDDGLRVVARSLTSGRLKIHESCTGLIDEAPGYVWDDRAQLRGEKDRPIKIDDHSLDALRYGVFSTAYMWEMLPLLDA